MSNKIEVMDIDSILDDIPPAQVITINGAIDGSDSITIRDLFRQARKSLREQNDKQYVIIKLNSIGGEIDCGNEIIKEMETLKFQGVTVYTIGYNLVASIAAIIMLHASPGCKFITESSTVLLHQISYRVDQPVNLKLADLIKIIQRVELEWGKHRQYITDAVKLTPTELTLLDMGGDLIFDSYQCMNNGITDHFY